MSKEPTEEKRAPYESPKFRAVSESELFAGYGQQPYYSPAEQQQQPGWGYYQTPYGYYYDPSYGYGGGQWQQQQGAEQQESGPEESGYRTPLCTLRDEEEWYALAVELPGAEPQEIDLYVGNYDVVVTTDPASDPKAEDPAARRFYGALSVPEEIDPEGTQTRYANGILHVQLAKVKPPTRRHIKIGAEAKDAEGARPDAEAPAPAP